MSPKILLEPFSVYTPVSDSIVAKKIYRDFPISGLHKVVPCDLFERDIIDFDIILSMDWLYVSYASIDYRTRRVKV